MPMEFIFTRRSTGADFNSLESWAFINYHWLRALKPRENGARPKILGSVSCSYTTYSPGNECSRRYLAEASIVLMAYISGGWSSHDKLAIQ